MFSGSKMDYLKRKFQHHNFHNLLEDPLFWTGLVLKLVMAAAIVPPILSENFIPFLNTYELNNSDPYALFYSMGNSSAFPYPGGMLYLLTLASSIIPSPIIASSYSSLVFHLPVLLFDTLLLAILWRWGRDKNIKKRVLVFYWLSPVCFYISYIHGQLDVIPIATFFLALHFLFREKYLQAAIITGIAISIKMHLIIAVPLLFSYMYVRSASRSRIIPFFSISILVFIAINIPFLSSDYFFQTTLANSQQEKIMNTFLLINNSNGTVIYIIPAAYVILFAASLIQKVYNRDMLITFLGFSFGILLLFIPPMPGWYYWLLPFLIYFYSKYGRHTILLWGLQCFYFLYLASAPAGFFENSNDVMQNYLGFGAPTSSIMNVSPEALHSVIFSCMQAFLLANCYLIFNHGFRSYSRHKLISKPYLIGIGGNSGSGKSTLTNNISNVFGKKNTTIMRGDDMHKWERGHEKWLEYTHLNPYANHLYKELHYLRALASGHKIARRHYDHSNGKFSEAQDIHAQNVVIFEGLHPFYLRNQRALYDLKIFLKPDPVLATHWKIMRDMTSRGYSKEHVIEQIERRRPDSEKYIDPQAEHADVIIEVCPRQEITNPGSADEPDGTFIRMCWKNWAFIDPIVQELEEALDIGLNQYYDKDGRQILEISGDLPGETIADIAYKSIPGLDEIGLNRPSWPTGLEGIITLIVVYYIFEHADYER
jgi:uridine kinase